MIPRVMSASSSAGQSMWKLLGSVLELRPSLLGSYFMF